MITPTIHLNGTARADLFSGYMDAVEALRGAVEAVRRTAPNGRDYYLQGPDAILQADREHRARMIALGTVKRELEALCLATMPEGR